MKTSKIGRCVRLATVAAGVGTTLAVAVSPAVAQDISINLGQGGGGLTERVVQLIAFITVLSAQTAAVILMFPLGHAGLTLATSLGACLNATLLYLALRRRDIYRLAPGWGRFLARLAPPLAVLGVVLWWLGGNDTFWLAATLWQRVARLALIVAAGSAAYFASLWLVGFRLRDFNRREAP